LARFADALDERMAELAVALRGSRRATPDDRLAAALSQTETELTDQRCANAQFIVDRLRTYVDAAARVARLVGVPKPYA
jgi:hypothetical protein